MSDNFKKRGTSEEAKFKHDSEQQFKVDAKRNKLLGVWAAEKLGLSGDEIEDFAKKVVIADLDEAGHEDVVRMVSQSFRDGGVGIGDDEIREKIKELQGVAEEEVAQEYPTPLSDDHGRVGD